MKLIEILQAKQEVVLTEGIGLALLGYPEATYQGNIYLIAWYLKNVKNLTHLEFSHILNTIEYGFEYLLNTK